MTVPTTWPRRSSLASDAAMGTSTWAITEPAPTISATAISTPISGARAEATRAAALMMRTTGTSWRRDTRSPSGTSRARPTANPIWASVTTRPAVPELVTNVFAMVSRRGWA